LVTQIIIRFYYSIKYSAFKGQIFEKRKTSPSNGVMLSLMLICIYIKRGEPIHISKCICI